MNIFLILRNGLATGAALTLATTAAIVAASAVENGEPWAAVNAVAHIVDGDEKEQPRVFAARETTIGLATNAAAMVFWGVLFEAAIHRIGGRRRAAALPAVAAAYVIDYHVVPPRLTPGIEKRLSLPARLAVYAAMAATLAVSGLWNRE